MVASSLFHVRQWWQHILRKPARMTIHELNTGTCKPKCWATRFLSHYLSGSCKSCKAILTAEFQQSSMQADNRPYKRNGNGVWSLPLIFNSASIVSCVYRKLCILKKYAGLVIQNKSLKYSLTALVMQLRIATSIFSITLKSNNLSLRSKRYMFNACTKVAPGLYRCCSLGNFNNG